MYEETRSSKELHSHDAWEPEWIDYVYSCHLQCTNDKCQDIVLSVGSGGVDWDIEVDNHGYPEHVRADFFVPKFFQPPLHIIDIPPECPQPVANALKESFRLFFSSPSAAAASVRIAIEELLTVLRVKRFHVTKNRKRQVLNLHNRIQLLPPKYKQYKDLLLAVKWLGNAGSHGHSTVTPGDVLDAYELTSHLLHEVYSPKTKTLHALAKRVNKRKGPAK